MTERHRTFAVLPGVRYPRLLVPLGPRTAAAAALRAYGGRLTTRDRLAYRGLGVAVAVTGAAALPAYLQVRDGAGSGRDIDRHLSEVLGTEVSVAVHLTPARANRKPIVQALAAGSRYPVGFAKVATNALTTELIDREAAALATISAAGLRDIIVPSVVDHSQLGGNAVLVMRPLPTWAAGRLPSGAELARAAAEVGRLAPSQTTGVRDSRFWLRLRADLELVGSDVARDALRRVADHLEDAVGTAEVEIGGGHGDWSPWNMWQTSRGLLVWDWERFATDVPLGSDLVHYRLQELLVIRGANPVDAARSALSSAPNPLVGALHLLGLAVRYDKDNQAGAGRSVRPSDEWLLPAVTEWLRAAFPAAGPRAGSA